MNKKPLPETIALASLAIGLTLSQSATAAFLEDSKASLSMRNMYLDGDNRDGGSCQILSAAKLSRRFNL